MDWLPDLILFNGDWSSYVEQVYQAFCAGFQHNRPAFMGKRMGLKRYPEAQGKSATFWHFVSSGAVEEDRLPDLRRCERIRWPRAIIDAAINGAPPIHIWENERNGNLGWALAVADYSYVVIIRDRGEYVLPWTAYYVEKPHQRRKLQREHEAFVAKSEPDDDAE